MKTYFNVHMVSDSTGETLNAVMRAACARFENIRPVEHSYYLVRSERCLEQALRNIEAAPGVVLYTIVEESLRLRMEEGCAGLGSPALPVIDQTIAMLGSYLGLESGQRVAGQHALDNTYFRRMEAINFCLSHDDGQGMESMDEADVVLVGVSRTSKTPTAVYLGNRGVRAGNIPLVPGVPFRFEPRLPDKPLIVGLKILPGRLVEIRRNRLLSMRDREESVYASQELVRDEILEANRLFSRMGWPVIDISRRSVEETAAVILNLLGDRRQQV